MPNNDLIPASAAVAPSDRYSRAEVVDTIKQTVAKGATPAQLQMFLSVCRSTGLDPFLKEIWYVPEKGIIMAGRDGYLRVANEHPQFDGMETHVERDANKVPVKATCTVWRKDRSHPIICEAWYSEYKKGSPVWSQYPSAMISKVAEVLALKRSFAINGVVSEEEMADSPRGSVEAARSVAEAKITGAMPLVPEDVTEPAPYADPLTATLAGFTSKAAVTAAFAELRKVFLRFEVEEAWTSALEQFGIHGDTYPGMKAAKQCFTALWRSVEKMQMEEQEGPGGE